MNISYENVIAGLLDEFPEFIPKDHTLPYLATGDFARYLLDLYHAGQTDELLKGLNFIEALHHSKHKAVRELATVGFLEDIQNLWQQGGVSPEVVFDYLGEKSQKAWQELNRFWNGEIGVIPDDHVC